MAVLKSWPHWKDEQKLDIDRKKISTSNSRNVSSLERNFEENNNKLMQQLVDEGMNKESLMN